MICFDNNAYFPLRWVRAMRSTFFFGLLWEKWAFLSVFFRFLYPCPSDIHAHVYLYNPFIFLSFSFFHMFYLLTLILVPCRICSKTLKFARSQNYVCIRRYYSVDVPEYFDLCAWYCWVLRVNDIHSKAHKDNAIDSFALFIRHTSFPTSFSIKCSPDCKMCVCSFRISLHEWLRIWWTSTSTNRIWDFVKLIFIFVNWLDVLGRHIWRESESRSTIWNCVAGKILLRSNIEVEI